MKRPPHLPRPGDFELGPGVGTGAAGARPVSPRAVCPPCPEAPRLTRAVPASLPERGPWGQRLARLRRPAGVHALSAYCVPGRAPARGAEGAKAAPEPRRGGAIGISRRLMNNPRQLPAKDGHTRSSPGTPRRVSGTAARALWGAGTRAVAQCRLSAHPLCGWGD